MKFEYDTDGFDDCVAFIDNHGDLVIMDEDKDAICFGNGVVHPDYKLSDSKYAVKKFYRGDKITITF